MTRHIGHSGSCSCTNCVYKSRSQLPSVQHLIETGSKIDRLYYGKYLPLRERKLLGKLIRTRAVYDDVRTQLLSGSGSSDQTKDTQDDDSTERSSAVTKIVDLVDRGQIGSSGTSKLSTCCSCCSCSSMKKIPIDKHPRIHRHSVPYEAIEKYTLDAKRKGRARRNRLSTKVSSKLRAVRFKAKRVRSAPCACTLGISSVFKRLSKKHLKRSPSKDISTNTTESPKKTVKIDHRASKITRCLCKIGKHSIKSIHKIKRTKTSSITSQSEGRTRKGFPIRKDSLMLFRDKLKKKAALKDFECEPGVCEPDECVPEDCYKRIKARSVGLRKKHKYPNKSSGTNLSQSHVSISTKKRVSNANVGKRVKKFDTKCMCPPKTTSSETTSEVTREITFQKEEPSVIGENVRSQTEKKKSKEKSVSLSRKQTKKQNKVQMATLCDCPPTEASQEGSQLTDSASQTSKSTYDKSILMQKSTSHAKKQTKRQSKEKTARPCDCPPTRFSLEGSQLSQPASFTSKSTYNNSISMKKSTSHAKKQPKKRNKVQKEALCDCPPTKTSLAGSQLNQSASLTSKSTYNNSLMHKEPTYEISEEPQYSAGEIESHPSRQAVRIGSTFSFNIEFYKEKSPDNNGPNVHESDAMREDLYESSPNISKERVRRIKNKHRSSQSISSHSKNAHVGHGLKRCFCTLKIPKRKQKPHRSTSRKTMTSLNIRNVDVVGQMRETQTKPFKHQGVTHVTPPLTSKPRALLPYECEPFFCTPGDCDPYECEKRIRVRNRNKSKYLSKEMNTLRKPKRSAVTLTTQYMSSSSKKNQSSSPKPRKSKRSNSSGIEKSQPSNRQGVRIGSNFSFNIEFSKEKICYEPENIEMQEHPRIEKKHYRPKGIKVHKPRLRHVTSQTMKTEKSKQTHTKKGVNKCICPSNILKETGTVTRHEYSQESSVLMTHKSMATEKEHMKHYRNQGTLLPYECEPGVCIPSECDPYECDKLIKMRNAISRNRGTNTCICPGTKSKISTTSKSVTSSKSRHSHLRAKRSKGARKHETVTVTPTCHPRKQAVRISSSFSFNVEFYKERSPADEVIHDNYCHKQCYKQHDKTRRRKETGVQESKRRAHHVSSSAETRVKDKGISVSSAIKRCFCTLKLHKKGTGKRAHTANNEKSTKVILKPKYCRLDVCDHHECCKDPKHRHGKRLKPHHADVEKDRHGKPLKPHHAEVEKDRHGKPLKPQHAEVEMDLRQTERGARPGFYNQINIQEEQTRHRHVPQQPWFFEQAEYTAERPPLQPRYNQFYVREEEIIHRPGQPGRAGSIFDFNVNLPKQGQRQLPETKIIHSEPEDKPKKKVKPKKPQKIKIKKEKRSFNLGLKLRNAMGSFRLRMIAIRERIKKIKLKRSVSQYTMVKIKKPKQGEPAVASVPVTAAFCQVIRDVNYKVMNPDLPKHNYRRMGTKEKNQRRAMRHSSKKHFQETYSRTKLFNNSCLFEKNFPSYRISRVKQHLKLTRRHRDIFPDYYLGNCSSKRYIRYDSSIGFDIRSSVDTLEIKTTALHHMRDNKYKSFNNTETMKSPFQRSYYALNVQVPNSRTKQKQALTHTLEKYECEPGFCIPGECDPVECLKRINSRWNSTKSSGTDSLKNKSVTSSTEAKFCTKCRTAQSNRSAIPKQRSSKGRSDIYKRPTSSQIRDSSRQSLSVGSNFSFKAEFYKEKKPVQGNSVHKSKSTKSYDAKSHIEQRTTTTGVNTKKKPCPCTKSQKTVNSENKGIGPMIKRCFCTLKLQKSAHEEEKLRKQTTCKETMANEPFGKISVYQSRKVMTDKLKPYECTPGICVPGECDPKKCYKLIQKRLKKGREQSVGTDSVKMKSGHTKFDKKHKTKDTKSIAHETYSRKSNKHAGSKGHGDYKIPTNRKPAVRFGSDITFHVEFYKDRLSGDFTPDGKGGKNNAVKSITSKKIRHKEQGQGTFKCYNEANMTSPSTKDVKGGTSMLEKCFCTLKLKKKGPKMGDNSKKPTKGHKISSEKPKIKGVSKNRVNKSNGKSNACDDKTCSDNTKSKGKSNAYDDNNRDENKGSKSNGKYNACDDNTCPDSDVSKSNGKSNTNDNNSRSKHKGKKRNGKSNACDDNTCPDSGVSKSNGKSNTNDANSRSKNKGSNRNGKSNACDDTTCPDSGVCKSNADDDNSRSENKGSNKNGKSKGCDDNTCLNDKANKNEKNIKSRRKRSKNTKVHKDKHEMSIKSDIPKKGIVKAEKRLTRSFECELHKCNSDHFDSNELCNEHIARSLKGVSKTTPKTDNKAKIVDINNMKKSRLSLIQRCVCAITHRIEYERNDVQKLCVAKELKTSRKSKLKSKLENENCDPNKQTDIETIMPPTKKTVQKGGNQAKNKRKIAVDQDGGDHQNSSPCRCSRKQGNKDAQKGNKGKPKQVDKGTSTLDNDTEQATKNNKPKKAKRRLTDTKNTNLTDQPEVCSTCKSHKTSKESQTPPPGKKLKTDKTSKKKSKKKVTNIVDSEQLPPSNNNMESGKTGKPKDKHKTANTPKNVKQSKTPKQRAKLVKTELNGYSFEIHGKNCQCSHCAEGVADKKSKIKKRASKKKLKLDVNAKTDGSYHGLYPCICSDKEIKKKASSNKSEKLVKDDGLCPMCKHCKDKEPLMATLVENGKFVMERINKIIATIRAKCEKRIQQTDPTPEIPLFEMVVNKGDMSIMNKEEIIDKVKRSSSEDRHDKTPLSPSIEMMIDNSDISIMNTDETRNKIMANVKPNKMPHSKSMQSKSLKYEIPMKPPVKGTKSERQPYSFQIHGKNCKCCYCVSKGRKKRDSQPQAGFSKNKAFMDGMPAYSKKTTAKGPCICGSTECKMELEQEKKDKLEEQKRAKKKPCVCGSKICGDETKKSAKSAASKGKKKKKKKGKKKEKAKPKPQKPDLTAIGALLCGKIDFNDFKYKIRGKVLTDRQKREILDIKKTAKAEKQRLKRKKVYAKEDAKRRKARIKSDKLAMKDVKKYKNTPDPLLCAESLLDVGKLGFSAVSGVLRTAFRAVRDPKSSVTNIKELARDQDHACRTVKETIAGSGVVGTAHRIKQRIGAMSRTQACVATMESHPVTNYMIHFADKDPKKRLVKRKTGKRVREPLDFECSLFMASLRKRPHLWVYYMCPWFYPHCISLVGIWRQFTDVLLFLLAVAVWSPCIFAMEACRALMCCFLCTG